MSSSKKQRTSSRNETRQAVDTATDASEDDSKLPNLPACSAVNSVDWVPKWPSAVHQNDNDNNSMAHEMQRLCVLQSYAVLDTRDPDLDRLAALAARMLDVKYSAISLVDLADVNVLANTGLGNDILKVPRKGSFCAHVVNTNQPVFVVPDTLQDERFCNIPFVTQPPHVRFYCGTPLISPEGYKIGSFCVLGDTPRPQGITAEQQDTLLDFAATAVRLFVDRRYKHQTLHSQGQVLASHDGMAPLMGLQLSLSCLKEQGQLDKSQTELVHTAASCAEVMSRIFQKTICNLRGGGLDAAAPPGTPSMQKLADLVHRLHQVMLPLPKQVPLILEVSPDAPERLVVDDLAVFRAALNVVSTACARTLSGFVRLYIYPQGAELILSCEDTAPDVVPEDVSRILSAASEAEWQEPVLVGIRYAVSLLKLVRGHCGYQKRNGIGSVFRISIPNPRFAASTVPARVRPPRFSRTGLGNGREVGMLSGDFAVAVPQALAVLLDDEEEETASIASASAFKPPRQRRALVIDDSVVIRKILGQSLSLLGFQVEVAENGMEGLEKMKECKYDIVLCDFLMPIMDGMDCVKQYRAWEKEHRPLFHQYIVGISAHASLLDSKKGIEVGMDTFQPKPVSMNTLKEIIQTEEVRQLSRQLDLEESNGATVPLDDSHTTACLPLPYHCSSISFCPATAGMVDLETSTAGNGGAVRHCLVAVTMICQDSTSAEGKSPAIVHILQEQGWICKLVHTSAQALECLQSRNWDAVVLDEWTVVCQFREWERHNRVHRQNHVFYQCPSTCPCPAVGATTAWVQPPQGMDGVLPAGDISWLDFTLLLGKAGHAIGVITR